MDKPLATLVHISDLHFGNTLLMDEGWWSKVASKVPFVQGSFPHSYQATRALSSCIQRILHNRSVWGVPSCVVFTGDLTQSGGEEQFIVGSTFLKSAHYTGGSSGMVGLNLREVRAKYGQGDAGLVVIPGNHDIWGRSSPKGLGAYLSHFPGTYPSMTEIHTARSPIFIYGLNSTLSTDLAHKLARGRVAPEALDELCGMLKGGAKARAIQIVCLHHPLRDRDQGTGKVTMRLEDRQTVAKRLFDEGVHLVMAGHVHETFAFGPESQDCPALAVAGTPVQQFSERSFLMLDVFEHEIWVQEFSYQRSSAQFSEVSLQIVIPLKLNSGGATIGQRSAPAG